MTGRKVARRPRHDGLLPPVHDALVAALASGCSRRLAAEHAGISRSVMYKWLDRGELEKGKDTPHARLYAAVVQAEATAGVRAISLVQKHAVDDWRAAAWYLSRKFPDEWGQRAVGPEGLQLRDLEVTAVSTDITRSALGQELDIDPLSGMLLSVRLAAGQVAYWRLRMQEAVDDVHMTDAMQQGYDRALQQLSRLSKAALDAGVDAKRVQIEERMADVITLAAEDAMGALDLSVKQRAAFTQAFVQALVRGQQEAIDA